MSFADAPFYDYVIMADHPLRPGAILHCEGEHNFQLNLPGHF